MRKILAILACSALALIACGDDDDTSDPETPGDEENPTVFFADDALGSFSDATFGYVTIDGMTCIVYKDIAGAHHAYSGLTCDWSGNDNTARP